MRNRTAEASEGLNVDQEIMASVAGSEVQLTRRCLGMDGGVNSADPVVEVAIGNVEIVMRTNENLNSK